MKRIQIARIILTGLIAVAFLSSNAGAQATGQQVGEIGSVVSEFSLTTFDGKTITDADLKEKVTLLVFWFPT